MSTVAYNDCFTDLEIWWRMVHYCLACLAQSQIGSHANRCIAMCLQKPLKRRTNVSEVTRIDYYFNSFVRCCQAAQDGDSPIS